MEKKTIYHNNDLYHLSIREPVIPEEENKEANSKKGKKDVYYKMYISKQSPRNNNSYLGNNFSKRKDFLESNHIPIFISTDKNSLLYIYNKINANNVSMVYIINDTYTIGEQVIDVDYHKYDDILPQYSEFMVFMEHITKNDNIYSYLIEHLSSVFFQSDLRPEVNTLSIITRFIDYNFPKEEIVYLFKKSITLNDQLELDNMLHPDIIHSFSHVDPDKFNKLEQWEKSIFYQISGFFVNIDDFYKEKSHYYSSIWVKHLPLVFLPGIFVDSLYELNLKGDSILPIVERMHYGDISKEDFVDILTFITDNSTSYATDDMIEKELENLIEYLIGRSQSGFNLTYNSILRSDTYLVGLMKLYVKLFYTHQESSNLGVLLMINIFGK